jgi:hypothetical protein
MSQYGRSPLIVVGIVQGSFQSKSSSVWPLTSNCCGNRAGVLSEHEQLSMAAHMRSALNLLAASQGSLDQATATPNKPVGHSTVASAASVPAAVSVPAACSQGMGVATCDQLSGQQPSQATAGGPCNCAVIVNPVTGSAVAQALDARQRHPLKHAVIAALDAAALWSAATWSLVRCYSLHSQIGLKVWAHMLCHCAWPTL